MKSFLCILQYYHDPAIDEHFRVDWLLPVSTELFRIISESDRIRYQVNCLVLWLQKSLRLMPGNRNSPILYKVNFANIDFIFRCQNRFVNMHSQDFTNDQVCSTTFCTGLFYFEDFAFHLHGWFFYLKGRTNSDASGSKAGFYKFISPLWVFRCLESDIWWTIE